LSPANAEKARPDRAPHNATEIATRAKNAQDFWNSPWTAGRSRNSVNDLSTDKVHQTLTKSTRGAYKIDVFFGETDA
jgi:hypothetical protein